MDHPMQELKIPDVKYGIEYVDNQRNSDDSDLDVLYGSGSETESCEYDEEMEETNISEVQKYSLSNSTKGEIQPEPTNSLGMGITHLTLESKADSNNRIFDDDREGVNHRNTKINSFVDVHQTELYKNQQYSSLFSFGRKGEFDNRTFESSKRVTKVIENSVNNYIRSKCTPSPVEGVSPNPSICADIDIKQFSDENSKKFSASNTEQVQPLIEKSPEIKHQNAFQYIEAVKRENWHANRTPLKIKKHNRESSSIFRRTGCLDGVRQKLDLFLHDDDDDNEIPNLRKSADQFSGQTIKLTEETLLGRRSQNHQTQSSRSSSDSEEKTARGRCSMARELQSKNGAIPAKIINGKENKKECFNERICEGAACSCMVLPPGENSAAINEKVSGDATRLLESNPTNTGWTSVSSDEVEPMRKVNVFLDATCSVRGRNIEELMYKNFTIVVERLGKNNEFAQKKCLEFLNELYDILENGFRKDHKRLLKMKLFGFKLINMKLEDAGMKLYNFIKLVLDFQSSELPTKPYLKDNLRENVQGLYIINSTLCRSIKKIVKTLRVIDDGISKNRSTERSLRNMIFESVELIKRMNELILQNQGTIQCLEHEFY